MILVEYSWANRISNVISIQIFTGKGFKNFFVDFLRRVKTPILRSNYMMELNLVPTGNQILFSVGEFHVPERNKIIMHIWKVLSSLVENNAVLFRFLLAARSSYFEEQLDSRWKSLKTVSVHNKLVSAKD